MTLVCMISLIDGVGVVCSCHTVLFWVHVCCIFIKPFLILISDLQDNVYSDLEPCAACFIMFLPNCHLSSTALCG